MNSDRKDYWVVILDKFNSIMAQHQGDTFEEIKAFAKGYMIAWDVHLSYATMYNSARQPDDEVATNNERIIKYFCQDVEITG